MDINYLSQLIHERELYEYKEYIKSQKFANSTNMRQLFTIITFLFLISNYSYASYTAKIMLDDDIELTIDVVDLVKSCNDWGYHYGFVMNISSRSLAGRAYNIEFNAYLYASLGKGKNVFGGTYTVSNTNPNLNGIIAHNNGKKVNYPSIYQCNDLQLEDVGLYGLLVKTV